jgi:hypothetical protein
MLATISHADNASAISEPSPIPRRYSNDINQSTEDVMGRGILLWLLGVPIPVIILLALLWR